MPFWMGVGGVVSNRHPGTMRGSTNGALRQACVAVRPSAWRHSCWGIGPPGSSSCAGGCGLISQNAMQPDAGVLQTVLMKPGEPPPVAGTGRIAASKLPSPGGMPAQEATECVLRVVPPGKPVGMTL
jgi:hypothetical protein